MVRLIISVESNFVGDVFLRDFLLRAIWSGEKPPAGVVDDLRTKSVAVIDSPFGKAVYKLEVK